MHPHLIASPCCSRRNFLHTAGSGFGMLALAGLLNEQGFAADAPKDPLAPHPPHFPAKAKSVIWLFMNGGQSQVDTWDYKPELEKQDGKELSGFDKNTGFFPGAVGPLMKSPFAFKQHGQRLAREVLKSFRRFANTSTKKCRSSIRVSRDRTIIRRRWYKSIPG